MKTIAKFYKDESGATAIEYGLLAALISVAMVATVGLVGGNVDTAFENVNDGFGAVGG